VRILVTGAGGMLARALLHEVEASGHEALPFGRASLDVTCEKAVLEVLRSEGPDAVVQCAAYTRVDDAEREPAEALRVNAHATGIVARACRDVGARFVYPGTDYVFDGIATAPYRTDAPTNPINAYGRSKRAGEVAALAAGDGLVVRTSWLYGPGGRNFVRTILSRARAGAPLRVVDDQVGAPTATPDLAAVIVRLLDAAAPAGIYHATNTGQTSWYGLACAALELAGVDADIAPCSSADFPQAAARPAYSVLDSAATWAITGAAPHWRDGLARTLAAGLD
jgi:dTDP-4-dehydrorhamnose reductase